MQNSGMALFHDDVNESATVNAITKECRVRGTLIPYLLIYLLIYLFIYLLKYHISLKSVVWELSCSRRTDIMKLFHNFSNCTTISQNYVAKSVPFSSLTALLRTVQTQLYCSPISVPMCSPTPLRHLSYRNIKSFIPC
jgi:hypothetical protein